MKKGFTLVEIMITVAIVALLTAIAIPAILRMYINANETNARATLRTISNACESFAAANYGQYPASMDDLMDVSPAYLTEDLTAEPQPRRGYTFTCHFVDGDYICNAVATPCGRGGTKNFTIITGGIVTFSNCN